MYVSMSFDKCLNSVSSIIIKVYNNSFTPYIIFVKESIHLKFKKLQAGFIVTKSNSLASWKLGVVVGGGVDLHKGLKKNFWGDVYIYYLAYGVGFTGICICQKLLICIV